MWIIKVIVSFVSVMRNKTSCLGSSSVPCIGIVTGIARAPILSFCRPVCLSLLFHQSSPSQMSDTEHLARNMSTLL